MITQVKMMFSVPRVVGPDTHPGANSSCDIAAVAVLLLVGVVVFVKVVVLAWRATNVAGIANEFWMRAKIVTRSRQAHGCRLDLQTQFIVANTSDVHQQLSVEI